MVTERPENLNLCLELTLKLVGLTNEQTMIRLGRWRLGEMCRVTMGHLKVTIGHHRVIIGHLRVTIGHLRVTVSHLWVTVGHIRVTLG